MTSRPSTLIAAMTVLLLVGTRDASAAMTTTTSTTLACGGAETGAATPPPLASPAFTPPAPSRSWMLQPVTDIPLPGSASRFDYQSFDQISGRLYIAHMGADQVVVFDTATQQIVGTIDDVKTPTGVLVVPELGRIFAAAAGSGDVAVIDAETLTVITHTGQIGFPDGLDYAPAVKQVFVSDESGGGELVIDATTNAVVTTIDIGGEASNTHYDPGSGCILVTVQSRNQLAVIDPSTDRLVGRYDLDADCDTPHGFLIEAPRRQAFVTCEDSATLLVVDLQTMAVTATYPVGDGPDVLAFDPGWCRLYVASESGIVSIFDERGPELQPVGEYQAPHAHSVAVDPRTHRVYLPLENVDGKPVLRILETAPASLGRARGCHEPVQRRAWSVRGYGFTFAPSLSASAQTASASGLSVLLQSTASQASRLFPAAAASVLRHRGRDRGKRRGDNVIRSSLIVPVRLDHDGCAE